MIDGKQIVHLSSRLISLICGLGHPAHFTVANRELMERYFTVMQMPASSCEFNSIGEPILLSNDPVSLEWCWSLAKRKFRTRVAELVGTITSQEALNAVVVETIANIDSDTF